MRDRAEIKKAIDDFSGYAEKTCKPGMAEQKLIAVLNMTGYYQLEVLLDIRELLEKASRVQNTTIKDQAEEIQRLYREGNRLDELEKQVVVVIERISALEDTE